MIASRQGQQQTVLLIKRIISYPELGTGRSIIAAGTHRITRRSIRSEASLAPIQVALFSPLQYEHARELICQTMRNTHIPLSRSAAVFAILGVVVEGQDSLWSGVPLSLAAAALDWSTEETANR